MKYMPRRFKGLLVLCLMQIHFAIAANNNSAADIANKDVPPAIGNFALPASQQPAPLISFGQTLIGKNQLQLLYSTFSPYHILPAFKNMNATMIYGFTDETSLYFDYPIASDPGVRSVRYSSLKDIDIQLEQAIYTRSTSRYQDLATLVGALTAPISDEVVRGLPLGFGSPSFFVGTTYNRTYTDWMFFISPGASLTTASDSIQLGSQYLYQAGIGHILLAASNLSTLFFLVEFDGQYTEKTNVRQHKLRNTGGNIISVTPSLTFSMKKFIGSIGVGFPVIQHLFGSQKKVDYFIASTVTYTVT